MKEQKKLIPILIFAAVIVVAGAMVAMKLSEGDEIANDISTFDVVRGPLTISVDTSGTIKSMDEDIVKCQVEGLTAILTLVPEGTQVKKGDLLVDLDSSSFDDQLVMQKIALQNAETNYTSTKGNLEVGKNQAQSDIEQAELNLYFAGLDLEKYLEGEFLNLAADANSTITLAEQSLEQAREKYDWSAILAREKYISQTELKLDKLRLTASEISLKQAVNQKHLFEDYTHIRTMAQLKSDVKQAEMALERTKIKAKADVIQLKAALYEAEGKLQNQKDILKKLETNIANTKVYAPSAGMVVYATTASGHWGSTREPLEEGQYVRERQELIRLPTSDKVKAEIKIHESSLKQIKVGLPVMVTVDAMSDLLFTGEVGKLAFLPDAQMVWLNPDLKVYKAEIYLDENVQGLRTGMSCRASIIVREYPDVIYIPVQAVVSIGEQPTVYVLSEGKIEPRKVEIGMDNNRMIHVVSGLEVGEKVVLAPPLAPAESQDEKMRDAIKRMNDESSDDADSSVDGGSNSSGFSERVQGIESQSIPEAGDSAAGDGMRQPDARKRSGGQRPSREGGPSSRTRSAPGAGAEKKD